MGTMGDTVSFHTYATDASAQEFLELAAMLPGPVTLLPTKAEVTVSFRYLHDSAVPVISNRPAEPLAPLQVKEAKVVRFGMLEGSAVVDAEWAVYDPQNVGAVERFSDNGSRAKRLALVLNLGEARTMSKAHGGSAQACAEALAASEGAEVVVIKMGPAGAFVWSQGQVHTVPAYKTKSVWKIGSGDMFVAHFARAWMGEGKPAHEAAACASKATAFYCELQTMPYPGALDTFEREEIKVTDAFLRGEKPLVYLAGPFFDTAQVWFIEEARIGLREMGLEVFSPFHDIGIGSAAEVVELDIQGIKKADVIFAIADGLDAGTIFEIGYARALDKPVVVLAERESDEPLKMAEGTNCVIRKTYTSALYAALWAGVSQ